VLTPSTRRLAATALASLAALALVATGATAAPAAPKQALDPEGGTPALHAALAAASQGYTEAHTKLVASRARQLRLADAQRSIERQVTSLSKDVDLLAADVYRGGNPDAVMVAMGSGSVDEYVAKAMLVGNLSSRNSDRIGALRKAREDLKRQREQVEAEVRAQAKLETTMAQRKSDAQRALGVSADSPRAGRAATRKAQGGSFAKGCSLDDPTTSGCLAARTVNALKQARVAGFTRFTACFRDAASGEHPLGRACDFSVTQSGFGGVASGDARAYGDDLAKYFINNVDTLGVLYVIWFKRIWLPGVGWEPYTRGNGDPSSDHTNHVHLSVLP
jgi:hypothetical protein